MEGAILRETLEGILSADFIESKAKEFGAVSRDRKRNVVEQVYSLVLSCGNDDSGVLADALRRYNAQVSRKVVRGSFYGWLDDPMVRLMTALLEKAVEYSASQPTFLPNILSTVADWIAVDSETITLRPELSAEYPGTGSPAAIKVHKEISLGRGGCMDSYHLGPAKEHDAPHLIVDERYRGKGLIVDLGYPSLEFIRNCGLHDVRFVIRLHDNWKPKVEQVHLGELAGEFIPGTDFDKLVMDEIILLNGEDVDCEVVLGQGKEAVRARLVMVFGPAGYRIYLTNLARETHTGQQISDLYRVRWEIEMDNKGDKSGARLDQIRATTKSSVVIQICAKLLHTLIVNMLIHKDNLERVQGGHITRGPMHRLVLSFALRVRHESLYAAMISGNMTPEEWDTVARGLALDARDPNWRRRPSILDRILGLTAPPGRPRKAKLKDCPASAASYRTQ